MFDELEHSKDIKKMSEYQLEVHIVLFPRERNVANKIFLNV